MCCFTIQKRFNNHAKIRPKSPQNLSLDCFTTHFKNYQYVQIYNAAHSEKYQPTFPIKPNQIKKAKRELPITPS